jgi:hypothetical protein
MSCKELGFGINRNGNIKKPNMLQSYISNIGVKNNRSEKERENLYQVNYIRYTT